ncbi:hypothetical protein [Microcoleus sp. D2_18a_D3]|uniref:hypothetical protein n=1 Tax=Microcoleus sp. D2_18a_D3 TaxID=3055330 RepID=UPI00403F3C9E
MILGECGLNFGEGEMSDAIANLFSSQSSLVPGYNPANSNAFTDDVRTSTMQSGSACNERTNVNRYCCGDKLWEFEWTDLYYSIAIAELYRGVNFER